MICLYWPTLSFVLSNSRCWLESSFVGTRTLDSPQTPVIDNSPPELARKQQQLHPHQVHLDVGLSPVVSAGQLPHRMNGINRIGNGGGESAIQV